MAVKLRCTCGKALSVKNEYAGRQVKCPACQTVIRVPRPKLEEESIGDDWDLEDSEEDDFDDNQSKTRAKLRGGKSSPTRASNSKQPSTKAKRKKSQPSNRNLLIGLSAGGGLLVIAVLAWMFWPATAEPNVAAAPNQNIAEIASATGGDATSSTNTTSVNPGSQPNVSVANPAAPPSTKLEGDLNFLQGTWQVSDVGVDANQPGAAEMIASAKQLEFTVKDDILTMVTPGGAAVSSIKLESTKEPKTIDLIPLDGRGRKTGLGIYALSGDSWTLCISFRGAARPTEMLFSKDLDHALLTLKRGTPPTSDSSAAKLGSQFDHKAWQLASGKLQALNVKASLGPWEKFVGTEGPTHFVMLTLPETADGTMSPELWAIVSSISHVALSTTFATDATLRQFAQHPGLLGIKMEMRSTVTTEGIGALKACPQLRMLMVYLPVSSEFCEAISQLGELRFLGISNSPVSKEMLSSIGRLSQLERLSLYNTGITDDDALQLRTLTNLKSLTLTQTKVTDRGLETLTSLTKLEFLELGQTKVTDEGLKTLTNLRGLKQLWLQGLNLTPQAVSALEASLPDCKIMK